MKRTERHRLKQNELTRLTQQSREFFELNKREIGIALVVLLAVGAALLGYWAWRERVQHRAHARLAEALAVQEARVGPPAAATGTPGLTFPTERERWEGVAAKFRAAADAYPSTDDGIFARYQQASALMSLGRPAEAAKAYQQVIDRAGDRIYGQMARLGLAEAQSRGGQYEQAINTFKELAQRKDGPLPIDAVLMQLGRTYLEAGRSSDARQTFNRLVDEYPDSPFTADAKRELDALKKA